MNGVFKNKNEGWEAQVTVVMNKDGTQKLYFIVETKGTNKEDGLTSIELLKTKFGRRRFEDVGESAYIISNRYDFFVKEASHFNNINGKTER